jgi:hypothetical protein
MAFGVRFRKTKTLIEEAKRLRDEIKNLENEELGRKREEWTKTVERGEVNPLLQTRYEHLAAKAIELERDLIDITAELARRGQKIEGKTA